jgi:dihydroflavonol-4-reductase
VIFVTGATGLLGNCIVREILARGESVRALRRRGTSGEPFQGISTEPGVNLEFVEGDLSCPERLLRAVEGCRAVVHSAAYIHIGWSHLNQSRMVNVQGTRNVIQACLARQSRLIHVSTVDTFPAARSIDRPINERSSQSEGVSKVPCSYVISKSEADSAVRDAVHHRSLDASIVHPGFMLGPYDWKPSSGRLMLGVSRAPLAVAPEGGCSLCDARDVAAGTVTAISRGVTGQSYILAGENLTYRQLWRLIRQTTGRGGPVVCSKMVLRMVGWTCTAFQRILPAWEGDVNGAAIAMGRLGHYYSSAKAQTELAYTNRPIADTLSDAWQWLNQRF